VILVSFVYIYSKCVFFDKFPLVFEFPSFLYLGSFRSEVLLSCAVAALNNLDELKCSPFRAPHSSSFLVVTCAPF
jgi:hypothetical protein